MRQSIVPRGLALAVLGMGLSAQADLTHRYSFNETSGTVVEDSVGDADGTLQGFAVFTGAGQVTLDGSEGTYVELPGGLITGYTAVTIEAWVNVFLNNNWSRIFDFGDMNEETGAGRFYIMMTPHSGSQDTRMSIAAADPGNQNELIIARPGVLDAAGMTHVAAVYDPENGFGALYINGELVAHRKDFNIPLSEVNNVHSFIGRSLYTADAYLNADVEEFRIYDHALSAPEVAASFASGPDTPSTDPGDLGGLVLEVSPSLILDAVVEPVVRANYSVAGEVDVSVAPGLTLTSSDPAVLEVTPDGFVRALSLGTATLTASYGGEEVSQSIEVVPAAATLKHRYSFSEASGDTAEDSVGGANGFLIGGASFNGDGEVVFDGVDGYVDLPNGIISALTNATFEVWVTWNEASNWQRVFDFGNNTQGEDGNGNGTTYLQLTPRAGSNGRLMFESIDNTGGTPGTALVGLEPLPIGQQTHVAITYSPVTRVAKMYVDGALVATNIAQIPLGIIEDVNNWLGRSNWPDPYLNGSISEFRIYEGALTDLEVAVNAAAGPDTLVDDPGGLQSVALELPQELTLGMLVAPRTAANFANVEGVNVTSNPETTVESLDPDVVRVDDNGMLDAVAPGTARIVAQFRDMSVTNSVTVAAAPGQPLTAELIHRYSFSETGGTTVTDSVGDAHGTVVGEATFGGGRLTLPGGGADSEAGYVDLPNGLISSQENITLEMWVTWASASNWQRIFDFGNNDVGEDQHGAGQTYLQLTPQNGSGTVYFEAVDNPNGGIITALSGSGPLPLNEPVHIVVTYNIAAGNARLFINGERVAAGTASLPLANIPDENVWLGRSNFADPRFAGSYDEFRIYNGILTDAQVAASFASGPDALPGESASLEAALEDGQLVISWPESIGEDAQLQTTSRLGPDADWTDVSAEPALEDGMYRVTISPEDEAGFFRLVR